MTHALDGIRVLDLTQVMAGPFCAMLLCDMGADVIKVESPTGDSTRRMPGAVGTDSPSFNAVNRGKRGVVVDLKQQAGQDTVRRLVGSVDVLVENYRPGVMGRLGLGYEELASRHPALVYASISGYGRTGPSAGKGGFDLVAQGVSGLMSVTGEAGRPPVKVGVPITDLGAGLFAVIGILSALLARARTGRGQLVDTSLVDAGVALSVWEATQYFSGRGVPEPLGSAHRMNAPYQAMRCADGYVTVGAANDKIFRKLCDALGHSEWAGDPDYRDDAHRIRNRVALVGRIEAVMASRSRAHWLTVFDTHDVPCGPINDYAEVMADAHVRARELVVETDHPTLGRIQTLGTPLKLSETPLTPGRPAPLLGQHTDEVLSQAGFSADEIAELRRLGAVG
ncbi:MAG: CoA transferase [Acidobacteria bacterium]|jgi:formyl-CoA transferase|nr:CoA transferase [Acidobacteriota bacterium]MDP7339128.1 CoA transferase [Vicinamibacterales bacterium]MDP7480294.1 CoA transferase [Vicinamibacterales bacterium]MDP7693266.1 CoA transferase [Vicinamibacterales bacterium]HJN44222.1 CoA transferase [Vicinamibacterales bacterium]